MTDRERAMERVAQRLRVPAKFLAENISLNDWDQIAMAATQLAHPEPPEPRCSVCGIREVETDYAMLVPVRVIANEGEEGHADVTQLLCDDHLITVLEGVVKLGFKDHRHGGANLLEDEDCPGARDKDLCPTPSEYGEYVVGQDST